MTEKLYWKDAYIKEFEASVVNVIPEGVVFDKTAFLSSICTMSSPDFLTSLTL